VKKQAILSAMKRRLKISIFLATLFWISACKTAYQSQKVEYVSYKINNTLSKDSSLQYLVQPYADSVHMRMNKVIAVSAITLDRKQPESTLGNLIADGIFYEGQQQLKTKIDGVVMNIGGIRLNTLAAGDITLGKVFELAPFDNTLVLMTVPGKIMQELCDHISTLGGWPVSHLSWQIKDMGAGQAGKKAINIMIDGKALDLNSNYKILTNDYVANGGDYCEMLRPLPQQTNGYLLRDALIDYFTGFTKAGKKISSQLENRVSNAN
jgi:2',3'-cyclic-nucleotide 2'-phosphodiesterase (5'-nucleotidase family)